MIFQHLDHPLASHNQVVHKGRKFLHLRQAIQVKNSLFSLIARQARHSLVQLSMGFLELSQAQIELVLYLILVLFLIFKLVVLLIFKLQRAQLA